MARILIADDDKMIHFIYSKIIHYLGHEVVSCYNGLEVLKKLEEESFDLVILDNKMPEMNGYDACQAIRKLPSGITIPIIIVSADDSQESILSFLNAGANDYILKPISEPIFIAKLKNFLNTTSLHKNELEMVREKVVVADRYQIVKVLGYGAHSVVFLANDKQNDNKKVAVKLLNQNILSDELIAAITELALRLQKADLENVIQVYDFGQYGGNVYMVLEYADSGDLSQQLKGNGILPEKQVLQIALDISKALVSMEKNMILHLDIKPENIMIQDGVYKVSDFGIIFQRSTATMPLNSEIWGTPAYSSPEVLMDEENVSVKSDIYSLGIILYEALIGDNPFLAEKPSVSMFRQLNIHPTSLLELKGEFSAEISIVIDMMLSKIPSQRPSPEEMLSAFSYIEQCMNGQLDKKLTYIDTLTQLITEESSLKSIELINKQVQKVAKDVSASTSATIHTKRWEKGLPTNLSSPAPKPSSKLKALLTKVAFSLIIFIVIYFSTVAISFFFSPHEEKYDFQGIPSVVICEACGNVETKPIIDIKDAKCSKCGEQEWYAEKCYKCGKYFPLNEDSFDDEDLSDDEIDTMLEKQYTCPFCGAHNLNNNPTEE